MFPSALNNRRLGAGLGLALACLLFIAIPLCKAQNLVPNHSFEDYDTCRVFNDVYYPDNGPLGWFSAAGTPDHYLSCLPYGSLNGAPLNRLAFQYPQDGEAYVGMVTYRPTEIREYFMVQLLQPLVVGERYYASFYANAAWGGYPISPIAWIYSNGVGMVFTTQPRQWELNDPYPTALNFSHMHSSAIITDTVGWTLVSGSFVADSAYQYMMLGNSFSDGDTDTLHIIYQQATQVSYTLIDNVCVSLDSLGCPMALGVEEYEDEGLALYPNPAQQWISIGNTKPGDQLSIQDMLGRWVWQGTALGSAMQLDVGAWSRGAYVLRTVATGKHQSIKFVLIQ